MPAKATASEALLPTEVPAESGAWTETTLGHLADYINGFTFKPTDWHEHGLPIVRIAQLTDPDAPCDHYSGRLPEQYLIRDGDLIFSWSATLMTLIWDRGPAYLNQHLFRVVPRPGTNLKFLHHLLDFQMDALASQAHGTTMRHIKRSDLLPFAVAVPAETEQRGIASVLDAADDAIQTTEQVLSKLDRLKQGLLHDFLTRGIDGDGALRDPGRPRKPLATSDVGVLPAAWPETQLASVVQQLTDGTHQAVRTGFSGDSAVPFLYVSCIRHGEILWDNAAGIDPHTYAAISKGREPRPGMTLYTAVGSYGHAALVDLDRPFAFQRHIACIYPDETAVDPAFLAYWLDSQPIKRHADRVALGNACQGRLKTDPFAPVES